MPLLQKFLYFNALQVPPPKPRKLTDYSSSLLVHPCWTFFAAKVCFVLRSREGSTTSLFRQENICSRLKMVTANLWKEFSRKLKYYANGRWRKKCDRSNHSSIPSWKKLGKIRLWFKDGVPRAFHRSVRSLGKPEKPLKWFSRLS